MTQRTGTVEVAEPAEPVRRRPSRAVSIALWSVVAGFAVWAVVRLFGLDRGYPLVQLISFTPYVAGLALLVPALALRLRRRSAAVVAGVAAVALVAVVLPRAFADGGARPTGPILRVLTANMKVGGADPAALVALVRAQGVDLLALQEFTPEAERALDAAGLRAALSHRCAHPVAGIGGSALYSRFPLRDDGVRMNPYGFGQAKATLTVPPAAAVAVESVHATAPAAATLSAGPAVTSGWSRSLAGEPRATVDGQVHLLLGDFNATLDHAALRQVIDSGYRDAADATGDGLTMTWPYDMLFPRVALDHVLADRRVGVRRVSVYPLPGSDHRAVYAELILPAP
jgi:endonuclease/exonuclease/phosphatase (EEP) superfamily protein YafD